MNDTLEAPADLATGDPFGPARAAPPPAADPQALRRAVTWYYFIPHTGSDGRHWYGDFEAAGGMELCLELEHALELAKRQRGDESRHALAGILRQLRALRPRLPPSLARVLERQYLGVHAYLRYLSGDHRRAMGLLARASAAALAAVDLAPFLLTLVSCEYEFCLHRARIARNRREWAQMKAFLSHGRAMVRGDRPLCRLHSGRLVSIGDLDALHRGLRPQSALESEALRILTDAAQRQAQFERMARGIELIGNIVTPFEG